MFARRESAIAEIHDGTYRREVDEKLFHREMLIELSAS